MTMLPVKAAHTLPMIAPEHSWLIEELWGRDAVGIIGGEPKCCKSFLALDMAVSIASGLPCLGRFLPQQTGRVLLFAAEDALPMVRARLEGISTVFGTRLDALDIQVITSPTLRLDLVPDRESLLETVAVIKPRFLVLDPFVRLHRIDENASAEVAPLLGHLRDIQREHRVAIAVVHHARKGGSRLREGQALRGSSEFHAWGDSNLYLRRMGPDLILSMEHRAAASLGELRLELRTQDNKTALRVLDSKAACTESIPRPQTVLDRVQQALTDAPGPLTVDALRTTCRIRTQRLHEALRSLRNDGTITKTARGYLLTTSSLST